MKKLYSLLFFLKRLNLDFDLFRWNFSGFGFTMIYTWLPMQLSALFVVYYFFNMWSTNREYFKSSIYFSLIRNFEVSWNYWHFLTCRVLWFHFSILVHILPNFVDSVAIDCYYKSDNRLSYHNFNRTSSNNHEELCFCSQ